MATHAHINTVPNGSTGGVMMKQHRELLAGGESSYVFWGRGRAAEDDRELRFATDAEVYMDVLQTRLDGRAGFHSKAATRRLLGRLDEIGPEVVHLHNLHGYYVNAGMLFDWLRLRGCRVEWTLHDCWSFTGHCAHFAYVGCEQWKAGCKGSCPQPGAYPKTFSRRPCDSNFSEKRRTFCSLPPDRMTLVSPSRWLAELVAQSFLSGYPIEVRHNSVDASVFKPTPSDFRERHGVGDRFMVLGVASPWSERKGLGDFFRLARELDAGRYAVVLIGLSARQAKAAPDGVICLPRTESREELAGIYTAADVFLNPTHEDNYPTVNLEAEACGTPVVAYDVGGNAESLDLDASVICGAYSGAKAAIVRLADLAKSSDLRLSRHG